LGGGAFGGRRIIGHDNRRLDAQKPADQSDGLGVISGRMRNDTSFAFVFGKLGHGVKGASEFERAHALEILAFQVDPGTDPLVESARGHHRCDVDLTVKPLPGGQDAVKHVFCGF
jgi:hypothetical protein